MLRLLHAYLVPTYKSISLTLDIYLHDESRYILPSTLPITAQHFFYNCFIVDTIA